jgi:hypothetical protein
MPRQAIVRSLRAPDGRCELIVDFDVNVRDGNALRPRGEALTVYTSGCRTFDGYGDNGGFAFGGRLDCVEMRHGEFSYGLWGLTPALLLVLLIV